MIRYLYVEPSSPPGIPVFTSVQPRSISLHWSGIECEHQNGYMTYVIEYLGEKFRIDHYEVITGTSSTSSKLSNLIPNTNYRIRICGLTSAGKGLYSQYNITRTLPDGETDIVARSLYLMLLLLLLFF